MLLMLRAAAGNPNGSARPWSLPAPNSEEANAGPKVAAILSVIESCRRLGVSARDYLAEVLPGLSDVSIQKVADLTPLGWKSRLQKS